VSENDTHDTLQKCGKSHGMERLKRKALRQPRKTAINGVECGGDMLEQTVPSKSGSNREGPITDGGQPCMTDIQRQRGGRSKGSLGLEISSYW